MSRVISHHRPTGVALFIALWVGSLLPDTLARCEPLPMLVSRFDACLTVISAGDKKAVTGTKR